MLHTQLVSLCFAVWTALDPSLAHRPDSRRVADAIADAVESERSPASGESPAVDAGLLAVYAALESGVSEHPRPYSWDARSGLSRGVWQLRGYLVEGRSLRTQAETWLDSLRRAGLARGVDSSPSRAARRLAEARDLVQSYLESVAPPGASQAP